MVRPGGDEGVLPPWAISTSCSVGDRDNRSSSFSGEQGLGQVWEGVCFMLLV